MDITILVGKIFGIYLMVAGLFLLIKGKTIPHLLRDFFDHPAVCYLTGIILIFLSSMYLIQYNIWTGTWQTLVTVFAWIVLIKGLAYVFIPQALDKTIVKKFRSLFGVYGLIALIAGAYIFFSI